METEFLNLMAVMVVQILIVSVLFWMIKKNSTKLDQLSIDTAVIKDTISVVKEDHDKMILVKSQLERLERDVHVAHEKIRALN